ncbi:hypothetical protein [Arundinibacter roseus]|uniref:Uncharacterized protein n=1 Tax=Arundinibacter roseus TaxID=2070510 RepID=A0A4R4KBQ0_9BACT|nr:hypothetical protein [Arundinibacter roseus]TDB65218.1 hypothetical protein EZE20_10960 [Arundinibacter roseus]
MLIFLLIGYRGSLPARAQPDNRAFENRLSLDSTRRLDVQVDMLGFVKNNEYFNSHQDGYTLWGTQLSPAFVYRISPAILLKGGVFWRNDFGETSRPVLQPLLTFKLSHSNWNFLFGTLEGNLSHRLPEPLYNFERGLTSPIENGLQINYVSPASFFDFWISYPQNTLPGYVRQEHFWGGLSAQIPLVKYTAWEFLVLPHVTVFHAGGQGIRTNLPVRTTTQGAIGFRCRRFFSSPLFSSLDLEPYLLGNLDGTTTHRNGQAFYINSSLKTRWVDLMLSYWNGTRYRSDYGGDLFISDSRRLNSPSFWQPHRNWLMLRFSKTVELGGGLSLTARLEPTLDLQTRKIEHSEGIYLHYTLKENLLKEQKNLQN